MLIARGVPMHMAQVLVDRCNALWGPAAWEIEADGVRVGGVLKVPVSDYPLLLSGLPYDENGVSLPVVKVQVATPDEEPPEEPLEEVPEEPRGNPLRCTVCGKQMPSEAALRGHMKKQHDR
jgi:hypothetical protein